MRCMKHRYSALLRGLKFNGGNESAIEKPINPKHRFLTI